MVKRSLSGETTTPARTVRLTDTDRNTVECCITADGARFRVDDAEPTLEIPAVRVLTRTLLAGLLGEPLGRLLRAARRAIVEARIRSAADASEHSRIDWLGQLDETLELLDRIGSALGIPSAEPGRSPACRRY